MDKNTHITETEDKPVKIVYEGKPIDENEVILELLKHLWEINDGD